MRAVPAIDLARPTSVCCIAVLSSLGRFASLYLLVERGIGRSTRIGYFFEVSAKLQGRVGFFGLAVMFWTVDRLLPVSPIRLLMKLIVPATRREIPSKEAPISIFPP